MVEYPYTHFHNWSFDHLFTTGQQICDELNKEEFIANRNTAMHTTLKQAGNLLAHYVDSEERYGTA